LQKIFLIFTGVQIAALLVCVVGATGFTIYQITSDNSSSEPLGLGLGASILLILFTIPSIYFGFVIPNRSRKLLIEESKRPIIPLTVSVMPQQKYDIPIESSTTSVVTHQPDSFPSESSTVNVAL